MNSALDHDTSCDAPCSICRSDWSCPYMGIACDTPRNRHVCPFCKKPCRTCQKPTDLFTGGPPLNPEEEAEVRAYQASFTGPDGKPVYHTGHLVDRLLRLPMHWYCPEHMPHEK